MSNKKAVIGKTLRDLMEEAVHGWPQFDDPDCEPEGADMVEWFAEWREEAKTALAKPDKEKDYYRMLDYCVTQLEQCAKMFLDDEEFIAVLDEAQEMLRHE